MTTVLTWFSALSFLGYGTTCLLTEHMRREFERYRLGRKRVLTGVLQLAGSVGLLVGFYEPVIGQIAAGGLALLMLLGVAVRIKIADTLIQTLPALLYLLLNAYLCVEPIVS